MQNWTATCGMILGLLSANMIGLRSAEADGVQHKVTEIKNRAARVFKGLDKDGDGILTGTELSAITARIDREIRSLTTAHVIGGKQRLSTASVVQTDIANQHELTIQQFADAFLAAAVHHDGEVSRMRLSRAHSKSAPAVIAAAPVDSGNRRVQTKPDPSEVVRYQLAVQMYSNSVSGSWGQSSIANNGLTMGGNFGGGASHHGHESAGHAHHHGK